MATDPKHDMHKRFSFELRRPKQVEVEVRDHDGPEDHNQTIVSLVGVHDGGPVLLVRPAMPALPPLVIETARSMLEQHAREAIEEREREPLEARGQIANLVALNADLQREAEQLRHLVACPDEEDRREPPRWYFVRRQPGGPGWEWGVVLEGEGIADGTERLAVQDLVRDRETAVDACWSHRDLVTAQLRQRVAQLDALEQAAVERAHGPLELLSAAARERVLAGGPWPSGVAYEPGLGEASATLAEQLATLAASLRGLTAEQMLERDLGPFDALIRGVLIPASIDLGDVELPFPWEPWRQVEDPQGEAWERRIGPYVLRSRIGSRSRGWWAWSVCHDEAGTSAGGGLTDECSEGLTTRGLAEAKRRATRALHAMISLERVNASQVVDASVRWLDAEGVEHEGTFGIVAEPGPRPPRGWRWDGVGLWSPPDPDAFERGAECTEVRLQRGELLAHRWPRHEGPRGDDRNHRPPFAVRVPADAARWLLANVTEQGPNEAPPAEAAPVKQGGQECGDGNDEARAGPAAAGPPVPQGEAFGVQHSSDGGAE